MDKIDGTIIDLACGTGRVTIPLARHGHKLIGVDVHTGMLDHAKKKAGNLPIKWVEQDCTRLNLGIKSPFIYMVGLAFQHFLTNEDQDQLLSSVWRHLEEDGIFIFDIPFPNQEILYQTYIPEYISSYTDPSTGQNVEMSTYSKYNYAHQIEIAKTVRKMENGCKTKTITRLRHTFPQELDRLAKVNGFKLLNVYKNWQEAPLSQKSEDMVVVLQKDKNHVLHFPGNFDKEIEYV